MYKRNMLEQPHGFDLVKIRKFENENERGELERWGDKLKKKLLEPVILKNRL
jgi:hypothetical protein